MSVWPSIARLGVAALAACAPWLARAADAPMLALRICADPANLPFSDHREQGFENRIARLLADALHAQLSYTWQVQRRGFLRRTLNAHACDVVIGVPAGLESLATTRPYYRSTYVFVSRRGRAPRDFDDPVLATMRIGLQAVGAEGANVPPAGSLSARNLAGQVVGYPMWAAQEDAPAAASGTGWPPADAQARIVDAVAAGEIDTAVVWGPVGAYFAARHGKALDVTPTPTADARQPGVAFTFDVAIGVRKGDEALKARLQRALDERRAEVDAVLEQYHVPLVNPTKSGWPGHPEPGDAR